MSRCLICGDPIGVTEPRDHRTDAATGVAGAVHRACTRQGIRRWNRENRPHGGPLEAARKESWTFTGTGPDAATSIGDVAESGTFRDLMDQE